MKNQFSDIKELVEELLISALKDDSDLKSLDKSIDPQSYSRTVYLAHALREFCYGEEK